MAGKSGRPRKAGRTRRGAGSASKAPSERRGDEQSPSVDAVETVDPANDAAARQALLASDKLYYRIGEVSRLTGVKAHVLRYWETEFRWMAPPKSRSKQRLYRKRDIEFVWLLKRLLWEERYTIAGARQRIRELGVEEALSLLDGPSRANPVDPASTGHEQERSGELPELSVLRLSLEEIQQDLLALREVLQEGA